KTGQRQRIFKPVGISDAPPVDWVYRAAELEKAHAAVGTTEVSATRASRLEIVGMSAVLDFVREIIVWVEEVHPEVNGLMPLFPPDDDFRRLQNSAFLHRELIARIASSSAREHVIPTVHHVAAPGVVDKVFPTGRSERCRWNPACQIGRTGQQISVAVKCQQIRSPPNNVASRRRKTPVVIQI